MRVNDNYRWWLERKVLRLVAVSALVPAMAFFVYVLWVWHYDQHAPQRGTCLVNDDSGFGQ